MPASAILDELKTRVARMEGRAAVQPVRTHPALEGLLQMHAGASYVAGSASLATLLLAGPSAGGAWCGVVGAPELGPEAAAATGVELSRTLWVPDPGDSWLEVTAALVDVLGAVLVRPPRPVTAGDAARVAARLRQRGTVLVVWGDWPRYDARLAMRDVEWTGLGHGHGHLRARRATLEIHRGAAPPLSTRLWWPDASLNVRSVDAEPVEAVVPLSLRDVG